MRIGEASRSAGLHVTREILLDDLHGPLVVGLDIRRGGEILAETKDKAAHVDDSHVMVDIDIAAAVRTVRGDGVMESDVNIVVDPRHAAVRRLHKTRSDVILASHGKDLNGLIHALADMMPTRQAKD